MIPPLDTAGEHVKDEWMAFYITLCLHQTLTWHSLESQFLSIFSISPQQESENCFTHRMLLCPSCCLSPLPVTQTFPLTARAQFLMCVPGFLNSGNFVSPCSSHILSHHQFYTCCPLLVCFPFWYCCFYKVVFSFCGEHWQPVEKVISNYLFTQNYVYYFFFRFLLNCNFFISMSVNCLPGYVSMSTHITEPL